MRSLIHSSFAAPRSSCASPYGRSKLHRRPSEPLTGGRHRAAAPRLREHYPVYARAPCARTVWTAPKPVLRAGGWVAATAPAPSSAGRSSAIIAGYSKGRLKRRRVHFSLPDQWSNILYRRSVLCEIINSPPNATIRTRRVRTGINQFRDPVAARTILYAQYSILRTHKNQSIRG